MTTAFLFFALFALMLIGMPIAFALGLASLLSILLFTEESLASLALKFFQNASTKYVLLAVPFFVLASVFLTTGGVAERLIRFATALVGHFRGGLAIASVVACMLFAAVSGSSPATVAAVGSICIAAMVRAGYSQSMAAGVIMNAGTLGILIPPSIVMLVYASATEVSAARMFMAGFVPGIMVGLMLIVAIYVIARRRNLPALPFPGYGEVVRSGLVAAGGLMLIVIVLGSIYGGIASPTEAAAVSAVYAFLVAVIGYRDMGPVAGTPWRREAEGLGTAVLRNGVVTLRGLVMAPFDASVRHAVLEAAKVSVMLLFVIANAMLFAHVLTSERIPHTLATMISEAGFEPWMFLILVNILLLAAGNFMEPSAVILIMAPILFPIALELGIDPIHLGIIMVVNMEIGLLTPPVGLNLFVAAAITKQSLLWAVRAALPWLSVLVAALLLITYVPAISLFLPDLLEARRLEGLNR
jgi:C4-dicarboxylate transporter, DctM subunit